MLSAGSVSGQPHRWWCHDIGYPLLDAEHLLCTAPWSGTLCRTTSAHSRTMSPLDGAWKPGFSSDTSVFSALATFVIIAQYKSTFTMPYHNITGSVSLQPINTKYSCDIDARDQWTRRATGLTCCRSVQVSSVHVLWTLSNSVKHRMSWAITLSNKRMAKLAWAYVTM